MKTLFYISLFFLFSCGETLKDKQPDKQDSAFVESDFEYKLDTIVEKLNSSDDSVVNKFIQYAHQFDTIPDDIYAFLNDDSLIKNIFRPDKSYIKNPKFEISNLFGVWGGQGEPVSDFRVDSKRFDVADYQGDGNMPYILYEDSIFVFYNDFVRNGKIIFSTKDSLIIRWKNDKDSYDISYKRWK